MRAKLAESPHILVIDDDRRICDLVCRYLKDHGFVTLAAGDSREAQEILERFSFDALVVDVMMPGESGLDFIRALRRRAETPVLFLTALDALEDRLSGFEAGGDDYLSKPFEPQELVMRLKAILRRSQKPPVSERGFKIGEWVFDPALCSLSSDGKTQNLTTVETNLLNALAQRPGAVMSRDELAELCGLEAGERTIDVQVTRLRRKIEIDTKNPHYLQTVRGKGYRLRLEEL